MTDKRKAQRWSFESFPVGWLHIHGCDFTVKDISYDSFSIDPGDFVKKFSGRKIDGKENKFNGILNILGREIPVDLEMSRVTSTVVAFRFVHTGVEVLIFLRDILECMRSGDTLKKIPTKNLTEDLQHKDVHVFMGDGPTSLNFRMAGTRITELSLTYRPNDYQYIEYRNGKWDLGKLAEFAMGFKSGICETSRMTRDRAASFIFILLAFKEPKFRKSLAPLIHDLIQTIYQERKAS